MDKDIGNALISQGVDEKLWNDITQLAGAKQLVEEGKIKVEVYNELKEKVLNNVEKKKKKAKGDKKKLSKLTQFASYFKSNEPERAEILVSTKRPVLESFLFKRETRSRRRVQWRKRYCILHENALVFYHKKGDKRPAGSIILNGEWFASESKDDAADDDSFDSDDEASTSNASSLAKVSDSDQEHQFILSDLNVKHRFSAETEEMAVLWIKTLTAVLRSLYRKVCLIDSYCVKACV